MKPLFAINFTFCSRVLVCTPWKHMAPFVFLPNIHLPLFFFSASMLQCVTITWNSLDCVCVCVCAFGALCFLGVSVYRCQWCARELWQNIPAAPLRPDHWMYAVQEEGKHTLILDWTHSEDHLKTQTQIGSISTLPSPAHSHLYLWYYFEGG